MSEVVLVTGGARSGKSSYAEEVAASFGGGVLYLATAIVLDDEMRLRVAHHQARRPANWITLEGHRDLVAALATLSSSDYDTVLLDCLGNLMTGILFEEISEPETCAAEDYETVEKLAAAELSALATWLHNQRKHLVIVTNEVGLGIVPDNRLSRCYRDILGRLNVQAAKLAHEVVLLVAGIPVVIKAAGGKGTEGVASLEDTLS